MRQTSNVHLCTDGEASLMVELMLPFSAGPGRTCTEYLPSTLLTHQGPRRTIEDRLRGRVVQPARLSILVLAGPDHRTRHTTTQQLSFIFITLQWLRHRSTATAAAVTVVAIGGAAAVAGDSSRGSTSSYSCSMAAPMPTNAER
eukprot:GHVU01193474.1.p2 GENE.GHVU01193474.1~~GHVU01193474.1.p2  ORF type:complete len:144 (+),score=11.84 GHVU01193474.1:482-913(+)